MRESTLLGRGDPQTHHPYVDEQDRCYFIRTLSQYDHDLHRQDEYQRLRADIFVKSLGWQIPVDAQGRERDRYDTSENASISVSCVYGQDKQAEHLLGGVRLIALESWEDSMIPNEFHASGMIPTSALDYLYTLNCQDYIEITRFCVRRGRWYRPLHPSSNTFSCTVARDLTYSATYALAAETKRPYAVGIVDPYYFKVMQRSNFLFTEIHAAKEASLVLIDLWGTIRSIRAAGDYDRAQRMLWGTTGVPIELDMHELA